MALKHNIDPRKAEAYVGSRNAVVALKRDTATE